MPRPLGFIIDQGLSPFNNEPWVAVLTLNCTNGKTGDMPQVYILCRDEKPQVAVDSGLDRTICGDCKFRKQPDGSRVCYVNLGHGPLAVYTAYKECKYEEEFKTKHIPLLKGRKIRWGAYGDPALIHPEVFTEINRHAAGHTGYTHQWHLPFAQFYKDRFQASCSTLDEFNRAKELGWKTFNTLPVGTDVIPGTKLCPETRSKFVTCLACSLCDGHKTHISEPVRTARGKKHLRAEVAA